MILVALVALFTALFLVEGLWTMRRKRNKRNREMIVSIRATVPGYPGRFGLDVRV